jgi:hypothetical protein
MQGFRSPRGLQRFVSVFSALRNLFVPPAGRPCGARTARRNGSKNPHSASDIRARAMTDPFQPSPKRRGAKNIFGQRGLMRRPE